MKKLLLTLLVGMFLATSLSASLGKGKMKASMSAGYKMVTTDNWSVNQFDIAPQSGFAFLSSNAAGLSFSYGVMDNLDIMYTMPTYQMQFISGEGVMIPVEGQFMKADSVDITNTKTLGSPLLGAIYYKDLGSLGLRVAPYLGLPFLEMYSMEKTASIGGQERTSDGDGDVNFDQQTLAGVSLAIDSKGTSKMFWQGWLNLQAGFGGDIDMTFTTMISGLLGYKLTPTSLAKFQLFLITPDLMNDADGALGFGDSTLKISIFYGMNVTDNSGFNVSTWATMSFTEEAKMTDLGEKATFVGGLTLDYWMTF